MRSFSKWVVTLCATPFGVVILAALDSTLFFSLPFGIDAAVIILAARLNDLWWVAPLLASAGSVGGAALTFWMGVKVGEKGLDRYVPRKRLDRIRARIRNSVVLGQTRGARPAPLPRRRPLARADRRYRRRGRALWRIQPQLRPPRDRHSVVLGRQRVLTARSRLHESQRRPASRIDADHMATGKRGRANDLWHRRRRCAVLGVRGWRPARNGSARLMRSGALRSAGDRGRWSVACGTNCRGRHVRMCLDHACR